MVGLLAAAAAGVWGWETRLGTMWQGFVAAAGDDEQRSYRIAAP